MAQQMKAVQVVARGRAEFVNVPVPEVRPGHVLVKCHRLSLCGSDVQMLHFAPESSYPFPPGTTGHEMVGHVVAVPNQEAEFKVGDRVLALAPGHLAMSEFFLAVRQHVIALPDDLPMEQLLQAQQYGTVIYACQRLPSVIGKNVVVIGQGSAGLWFNFQLRRMGASQVLALDLEDFRLAHAEYFGATAICNNSQQEPIAFVAEQTNGQMADLVVEAAGEVDSINLAVDLVRKFGDILYFGYPRAQRFEFNYDGLFHKCCRATTIVGAAVEPNQTSTKLALDVIARGEIDVSRIITHRLPFADVNQAYELHKNRADGAVKIVIEMPE